MHPLEARQHSYYKDSVQELRGVIKSLELDVPADASKEDLVIAIVTELRRTGILETPRYGWQQ